VGGARERRTHSLAGVVAATLCGIGRLRARCDGACATTEVTPADQSFRLRAEVVYVDRVKGFAVRFLDDNDPAEMKAFTELIDRLAV
jgi:hypothetical protein